MRKKVKKSVLILVILILCISNVFLVYMHFFASGDRGLFGDRDLSGEWTASLDMTEQAAVTALIWLQDIEAVSISLEDMEPYMQDLTIQVDLTLEQTAPSEGTFCCNVLPESYDACNLAAYEAFAGVFRELLAERLHMAGYSGGTDGEAIEALVTETFGMSTVSYLMSCGPALLPALEDLQIRYDGSGTYKTAEGVLNRQFEGGWPVPTRAESYIREDSSLILFGEKDYDLSSLFPDDYPMIYTLKQPQNNNEERESQ